MAIQIRVRAPAGARQADVEKLVLELLEGAPDLPRELDWAYEVRPDDGRYEITLSAVVAAPREPGSA